jgi:hypothetical protein
MINGYPLPQLRVLLATWHPRQRVANSTTNRDMGALRARSGGSRYVNGTVFALNKGLILGSVMRKSRRAPTARSGLSSALSRTYKPLQNVKNSSLSRAQSHLGQQRSKYLLRCLAQGLLSHSVATILETSSSTAISRYIRLRPSQSRDHRLLRNYSAKIFQVYQFPSLSWATAS